MDNEIRATLRVVGDTSGATSAINTLRTESVQLARTVDELSRQSSELAQARIDAASQKVNTLQANINRSLDVINGTQLASIRTLKGQIEEYRSQLTGLAEEFARNEANITTTQQNRKAVIRELTTATSSVTSAEKNYETQSSKLAMAIEKVDELENKDNVTKKELTTAYNNLTKAQTNMGLAEERLNTAQARRLVADENLSRITNEIMVLQQRNISISGEAVAKTNAIKEAEDRLIIEKKNRQKAIKDVETAERELGRTEDNMLKISSQVTNQEMNRIRTEERAAQQTEQSTRSLGQAATALLNLGRIFLQSGKDVTDAGKSTVNAGRDIVTLVRELSGLRTAVTNIKTAWTEYVNESQKVSLAFSAGTKAVITLIASIVKGVATSVNWKAAAIAGASATINLGKAFIYTVTAAYNFGRGLVTAASYMGKLVSGAGTVISKISSMRNVFSNITSGFATTGTHVAGLAVRIQGLQMGIYAAGGALTAFGSKGKEVFSDLLTVAGDFQQKIITLGAILGSKAGELKTQFRDLALEMGKTTLFSPNEAADVISELVKAGFSVQEVMGGAVKAVLNLSTATGEDLATSINAVVSSTRQWANQNLTAEDSVDRLTKVANATATDVGQLVGGMKNAGAIAASMGVSFKDTLDLLGALSNAGLKGPEAGTALRYFFLNLVPSTQKGLDIMKQMKLLTYSTAEAMTYAKEEGIKLAGTQADQLDTMYKHFANTTKSFDQAIQDGDSSVSKFQTMLAQRGVITTKFVDQATGQMKDAATVLQMIYDKIYSGKGAVEGTKLLSAVFGERGGSKGAAPLMIAFQKNIDDFKKKQAAGTLTSEDDMNLVKAIENQLADYGGAADIAKQRTQGFAGSMQYLKSSIEGAKIVLGEPLLQPIATLLRFFGDLVNKVTDFGKTHPELVKMVGTLLLVATAVATVAGPLMILSATLPMFATGLTGIFTAALPLTGIITVLGGIITALSLVIGDPATQGTLMGAIAPLKDWFGDFIPRAVAFFSHIVLNTLLPIGRAIISMVIDNIIPALMRFGTYMSLNMPNFMDGFTSFLINKLFPFLGQLVTWFLDMLPGALHFVADVWNNVLTPLWNGFVNILTNFVFPVIVSLINWFRNELPGAVAWASNIFRQYLLPAILGVAGFIMRDLIPVLKQVFGWFGQMIPIALQWVKGAIASLMPIISTLWNAFVDLLPVVSGLVGFLLGPFLRGITDILGPILQFLFQILGVVFRDLKISWDILVNAWNSDFAGIKEIVGAIVTFLTWAWDTLIGIVRVVTDPLGKLMGADVQDKAQEAGTLTGTTFISGFKSSLESDNFSNPVPGQLQEGIAPSGAYGFQTGNEFKTQFGTEMNNAVGVAGQGVDAIAAELARGRIEAGLASSQMAEPIKTALEDVFGTCDILTKDWRDTTLGTIANMHEPAEDRIKDMTHGIESNLTGMFNTTSDQLSLWKYSTLGAMATMVNPAIMSSQDMVDGITTQLATGLGVAEEKVADWKNMTIDQLAAMSQPTGKWADYVGKGIKDSIMAQLGIANTNIVGWRDMTLADLYKMTAPAAKSGYDTGYNFSAGIAKGIDSNVDAIVARVKFLRQQLGEAIDIFNATKGLGKGTARMDVDDARRAAADAEGKAETAGVPKYMLDMLAGSEPTVGGLGAYNPGGAISSGPLGGSPDNTNNPDTGGSPDNQNTFDKNTNNPGSSGSGGTTRSPAQQAADIAKTVADAIKAGVDALRRISGLTVPSNLEAKAKEFARALTVIIVQLQAVALKFSDKNLITTQNFADAGLKAMELIVKGVDAFSKLPELKAPTTKAVNSLVSSVDMVVRAFSTVAHKYSVDVLTQTDIFADTATKVVDLVGKGADAFGKLEGFTAPVQEDVQSLVNSVDMTLEILKPIASQWAPQTLDVVSEFSDAAGKVMDGLSKAVDLFNKLNDVNTNILNADSKAELVVQYANEIALNLSKLVSSEGWTNEQIAYVSSFADAVGKVMDSLTKSVDLLDKLSDPKMNLTVPEGKVRELVTQSFNIMATISSLVLDMPGKPGWNQKNAEKVASYTEQVGKVAESISKAADLINKLSDPKFILVSVTERIKGIADESKKMMDYLTSLWTGEPSWNKESADKVSAYTEDVGKVADSLSKSADLFNKLSDSKFIIKPVTERIKSLAEESVKMMRYLSSLWSVEPAWTVENADKVADYADASGKVSESLSKAADLFNKLSDPKFNLNNVTERVKDLSNQSVEMMRYLSLLWTQQPLWSTENADKVGIYSDAVSKVADSLDKAMTFFTNLAKNKTSFAPLAERVKELVNASLQMMNTLGPLVPQWDDFVDTVSKFSDATAKVADGLDKVETFLTNLSKNKKTEFKDLAGRVTELVNAVIQIMATVAKGVPSDYEDGAIPSFMDSATKTADALDKVLDFMTKLGGKYKLGTLDQVKPIVEGLVNIVHLYQVSLFNIGIALDESSAEGSTIMATIADNQSKVIGLVSSVFDLFSKLGEAAKPKVNPSDIIAPLLSFMLDVVRAFSAAKDEFAANIDEDTASLASLVGNTINSIGGTFDFFTKLADYKPVAESSIDSFIEGVRYLASKIKILPDAIAPEILDAAQNFGDKLGSSIELLKSTLDLFLNLMGTEDDTGKVKGGLKYLDGSRIDLLIEGLRVLVIKLRDGLLTQIAPEIMDLAKAFGEKIGPAMDVISKALDIFMKINGDDEGKGKLRHVDPAAIGELVGDMYILLHHWSNLINGGEFQGEFVTRSQKFAETVDLILTTIQKAMELAGGIKGNSSGQTQIIGLVQAVKDIGSSLITVTNTALPPALTSFVQFFGKLSDMFHAQNDRSNTNSSFYWWEYLIDHNIFHHTNDAFKPQLVSTFESMFNQISGLFQSFAESVLPIWNTSMSSIVSAAQQAVSDAITALQSLNNVQISVSVTTTGSSGGSPTGSPTPPPSGGTNVGNNTNNTNTNTSTTVNNYNIRQVVNNSNAGVGQNASRSRTLADDLS